MRDRWYSFFMIPKALLERRYLREGKSFQEIADALACSVNCVQYWMRRHGIPSRTRSEALYVKCNPSGDPFAIKSDLNRRDLLLMGLGMGLWWGEGNKRQKKSVRLGNTDPELIQVYIAFLTEICGVKKERLHFGLQVFSDMDPAKVKRWWLRHLRVRPSQFLPKTVVTPARGIGNYREKTKYGVLTVYCYNVKLRSVMDRLLEQYGRDPFIDRKRTPT